MLRILPLLLLLACTGAYATEVANLYTANVPVSSQSNQARNTALHDALAQVIVKVTGSRAAPDDPQVASIVGNAQHYLQAYRYERHVPRADEPVFGAGAAPTLDLWAQFDSRALDAALRAAGQPLWGSERPATLVWIAYQEGDQRQIVSTEAAGKVVAAVQEAADARGLPVIFPLMDVDDRSHLGFSDVWGGFVQPVVQASQRYQPNAILVGRIDATDLNNAASHWTLIVGGQPTSWDGANGTPVEAATAAIQHLADVYASKFVIRTGAQTIPDLKIVVSGIDNLQAYGQVLKYLRSLSAIGVVEPTAVAGDSVTYTASARGSIADLRQTIALGALLTTAAPAPGGASALPQPLTSNMAAAAPTPVLHYRYQP